MRTEAGDSCDGSITERCLIWAWVEMLKTDECITRGSGGGRGEERKQREGETGSGVRRVLSRAEGVVN